MDRRCLLRTAAMLPLLSGGLAGLGGASGHSTLRRVRPSEPEWPSVAKWDALNRLVGGNLIKVRPLFASCSADPESSECREVIKNARNPFYLGDQPAGTQVSGWLDAWTPAASYLCGCRPKCLRTSRPR